MLTASGDQCVHLWDTASAQGLGQFRGHNGSVKSVCPSPGGHPIFASGSSYPLHFWPMSCIACCLSCTPMGPTQGLGPDRGPHRQCQVCALPMQTARVSISLLYHSLLILCMRAPDVCCSSVGQCYGQCPPCFEHWCHPDLQAVSSQAVLGAGCALSDWPAAAADQVLTTAWFSRCAGRSAHGLGCALPATDVPAHQHVLPGTRARCAGEPWHSP
jgi:hypothetical protein